MLWPSRLIRNSKAVFCADMLQNYSGLQGLARPHWRTRSPSPLESKLTDYRLSIACNALRDGKVVWIGM